MKNSSITFQINQDFKESMKNFIYKGKTFPFDFDIFKQNSKYFFQNRKILKNVKNINLLNEEEEKIINLSDESIQAFINCCQNQMRFVKLIKNLQLQVILANKIICPCPMVLQIYDSSFLLLDLGN